MNAALADERRSLGRRGEELACRRLEQEGFCLLARNWRTRAGELDIVARDGNCLVFVEVRSRRSGARGAVPVLGAPEESVTARKRRQIRTMAETYMLVHPWEGPWRIDVIAVEFGPGDVGAARVRHFRDAVEG